MDLANGNLSLRIPLVTSPGRNLPYTYTLAFDSKFWAVTEGVEEGPGYSNTSLVWGQSFSQASWGWQLLESNGGGLNWSSQLYTCAPWPTDQDVPAQVTVLSNFVYTLPDGTQVRFPNRLKLNAFDMDRCMDDVMGLADVAVGDSDRGGFRLTLGGGDTWNTWTYGIRDRSGANQAEDSNGNLRLSRGSDENTYDSSGRLVIPAGGGAGQIQYRDPNGTLQTITLGYTTLSLKPPFPTTTCEALNTNTCSFVTMTENMKVVSSVTLPDGSAYTISYVDPATGATQAFGEPTQITLPGGGWIKYTWAVRPQVDQGPDGFMLDGVYLAERQESPGDGTVAVTDYAYTGLSTVVTGPAHTELINGTPASIRNDAVHSFNGQPCTSTYTWDSTPLPLEYSVEYFQGSYTSGTPLRRVDRTWACDPGPVYSSQLGADLPDSTAETTTGWRNPRVASITTTLEDVSPHLVKETTLTYGDGFSYQGADGNTYFDTLDQPTLVNDYDWGSGAPGPLLRQTLNTYLGTGAGSYGVAGAHMLDRIASQVVLDGKGTKLAETDNAYDSTPLTNTSNAANHDYSVGTLRGNLTEVSRWVSGTAFLNSFHYYNDLGDLVETKDPAGNPTYFDYTDQWAQSSCVPPTGSSLAFVTKTVNALNQVTTATFDSCGGKMASQTDPNSQTWSWSFDAMDRLAQSSFPDGGATTYSYTPTTLETKRKIDSSRWTDAWTLFDGLGRAAASSTLNGAGTYDRTDTCYNGAGEVGFSSYSYFVSSATAAPNCSGAGDSFLFDALGRETQTTHSDGTTFLTSYAGRATETQDEGNGSVRVTRIAQTDGLGNLASVCEITSVQDAAGNNPSSCNLDLAGTGFLTTYSHDALGNLLGVTQIGAQGTETRSFLYDGLSRLLSAANPETGNITYVYDSNGSCTAPDSFPGDLVSRTDARGILTCYQHDPLHRLTLKHYSDGTTTAAFWYDQASGLGTTFSNPIGRLTSEQAGNTVEGFGYDPMGRVAYTTQATPNVFGIIGFVNNYQFDLAGDLTWDQSTYNRGAIFTTTHDAALRPTSLTSTLDGPLISGVTYYPDGREHTALLGNGVAETRTEDGRGRLTAITDDTSYAWAATLANDSDPLATTDSANGSFSYALDAQNRLTAATCSGPPCSYQGTAHYSYDRFGNRWTQAVQGYFPPSGLGYNDTRNQPSGWPFDPAGELNNDGAHGYAYDAETRLNGVFTNTGQLASYVFDAEGRRVHESVAGSVKEYIYAMGAIRQTLVDASQNLLGAEVYFGGRYLGTRSPSGFVWAYSDNLGTVRQRSNGETDTSWPFGEYANFQMGTSPLHFTGKYRDSETSLDYFGARYYSSQIGRFLSPDWSDSPTPIPFANLENPQSLNLYSYVLNNPASRLDSDGHVAAQTLDNLASWAPYESGDTPEASDPFYRDDVFSLNSTGAESDRPGGGPYYAKDPAKYMGKECGSGQCVDFVKLDTDVPRLTSEWRAGPKVDAGTKLGTAIATFGPDGRYKNKVGQSHAAELVSISSNGKSAVVRDQWLGHAVSTRTITDRGGRGPPVNDLSQYHVIMGPGH